MVMNGNIDKIDFIIKEIKHFNNGNSYDISIKIPDSLGFIDNVNLVIEARDFRTIVPLNFVERKDGFVFFKSNYFLNNRALYHYYFSFTANEALKTFKKTGSENDRNVSISEKWKLDVNFKVPDWAKGSIMYHIFVDRFNRGSNDALKPMPRRTVDASFDDEMLVGPNEDGIWNADFYGGDLKGIQDKLDYIKDLGVDIIYLSPIVWSQSNHRYDTSDYENVDPYVGKNDDLKKLCDEAHKRNMKVVLDAVFNHTGNDSKYFNEFNSFDEVGAFQSKDSKYYPFYRTYYDNNQTYFDYWWGMKNLPVCDGNSKEWQNYIYGENGIIDKWFELGIDGLRLDVADELTDDFIYGIRKAVKRNKEDGFIIGEVWKNPMRMNRGYLDTGSGMDSVMNYVLVDALIRYIKYGDFNKLKSVIDELKYEYPDQVLNVLMNFTSTHDISRGLSIFGTNELNKHGEWAWDLNNNDRTWQKNYKMTHEEYKIGKEMYKLYVFILTFFPGILSIFYGDELGMTGLGNLANRKPFIMNNDKDLLYYFKEMGKIRKYETFLKDALLENVIVGDKMFSFERIKDPESAFVIVNRTSENLHVSIPKKYLNPDKVYSLNKSSEKELTPFGGLVLKKTKI